MMKSFSVFWLVGWVLVSIVFSGQARAVSLVFNTQDFQPFSYKVEGEVQGPAVEIIKTVCQKIGINCSFRLLPWTRAQKEVEDGSANAMFVIGKNAAREKWLYFSPPLMKTEYGFFVKNDNPLIYKNVSDIEGYKVGVYGPSNTSKTLEKIKDQLKDLTIDLRPDDESGFKKLSGDRITAVFSNKDVGNALIKKINLTNLRYAGKYKELNYFIGFSKQFNSKEEVDRFNSALMQMYTDGSLKAILDKYFMDLAMIK
ncbi:MAG: transporter substrate-binding domain-containing protein [Proteobacteria bacterium]|nr:transporter substrate-binding domain-containing protein [Pseudomonadota bacterium]MBU1585292.1 transporter substrate-binding domain-containing protein [Pseudomonadota bacterium]MBU2452446.1 transporter substrate-binding domain-containing protein [Pseudomonadota bacterium]MBU2630522.1 transporter substrate-binding domain-containing protein [Pseudomonadota bacterium]